MFDHRSAAYGACWCASITAVAGYTAYYAGAQVGGNPDATPRENVLQRAAIVVGVVSLFGTAACAVLARNPPDESPEGAP